MTNIGLLIVEQKKQQNSHFNPTLIFEFKYNYTSYPKPITTFLHQTIQNNHNTKKNKNISEYSILKSQLIQKTRSKTLLKRNLIKQQPNKRKIYDDDLVKTISEEFSDRIRVVPIIGNILKTLNLSLIHRRLTFDQLLNISIKKVSSQNRVTRSDITQITKIKELTGNSIIPFMNGKPSNQHWNTSDNGFYDWLDKKSQASIFKIELGFKANDYGLEVSNKLINRKQKKS